MNATANRNFKPLLIAVAFLVVALTSFVVGRRYSGPGSPSAPAVEAEHGEEGHAEGEHAEEEGVIKFDDRSLKLAGIQVEPVSYRVLNSRLAVTGTVEPDLGGVVKVTPRVVGKLTSLRVNVGDSVRSGETLASLASTELAASQAAYRQAQARVDVARATLARQRQLAGLGEFGRHKVDEARQREIEAHGEINAALSELASTKNEVTEARSELAAFQGEVGRAESEAASAESEIKEAESQVRALQAALEQAQTQVRVAESRFKRADILHKEQIVSRQDWEQAQADHQRAQSDVDAARANIAQGQAKVETARSHLRAAQAKIRADKSRVEQAAAKVETALSRQAQVETRLTTARKRDALAEQALAREERVYKGGFLTSKEILDAEAAVRVAQAEQRAAADTIRLLGGVPGGGSTIPVTAPIGGRVTERLATLGETVSPDKPLLTVMNLNSVWVQLNVHQRDLPAIRAGQPVSITADTAPGRTFNGVISHIGDVVDETTRTVKVRCALQGAQNLLRPDTFVRGTILTSGRTQALAIPRDAVQTHEGKTVVFVQADHPGEFQPKEVQAGDTVAGQTIIQSGLQPGDLVVTKGAFLVKAQAMKSELGHEH